MFFILFCHNNLILKYIFIFKSISILQYLYFLADEDAEPEREDEAGGVVGADGEEIVEYISVNEDDHQLLHSDLIEKVKTNFR